MSGVAIIGAGYAGLTAALALAQAGTAVTLFEALGPGGELVNLPAVGASSGPDLAGELLERALTAEIDVRFDEVVALRPGPPHELTTAGGDAEVAGTVVLAMGAEPLRLGLPGEAELAGRGVSYCVGCDAGLFRGAATVVLAGGPYAEREAAQLAGVAGSVAFVSPTAAELAGVRVLAPARALRIEADERGVTGVAVAHAGGEELLAARGVFVCAGAAPRSALVNGVVALDPAGGIVVDARLRTSVPGIYAIGDVRAGAAQRLAAIDADVTTLQEAL